MVHHLHRVDLQGFEKGLNVESVEAVQVMRSGMCLGVPPRRYPPLDIGLSGIARRLQEGRRGH